MRIVLTFFWVLLGFLILYIFSQNVGQTVSVDLLFVQYEQVNLITVTFICLLLGFILGSVFFTIHIIRSKKEKNHLLRQVKSLTNKLAESEKKQQSGQDEESDTDNEPPNHFFPPVK
ncbi:MAG: LapA family protein [Calditrichae bacterium]|nr:LapA family protein [Calditrichota bacterium]MCB9059186.1 LapA family protein [Calditrichia bacterium]